MNDSIYKIFQQKYLPYITAYFAKFSLKLILYTCRFRVDGLEQFHQIASKKKCILMLWHNRLALVAEILYRYAPQFLYAAFVSNSRDGKSLDVLAKSYSIGKTIRVPHNAKHKALRKMINHLKYSKEIVIVIPDGPKGPRYEVKPGIAVAAKESKACIVPLTWSSTKFWQLNTWDKMILPKPFSTIVVSLGTPIKLSREDKQDLETESHYLKTVLSNLEKCTCQQVDTWPN